MTLGYLAVQIREARRSLIRQNERSLTADAVSVQDGLHLADEAEAAFRKAVEADPQSVEALYQLGRVQLLRNRRAEAIASFRKLQQLDPTKQLGRLELLALESGRDPATTAGVMEREARELAQKQPDQPSRRTQLGAILLSEGKTDDAEAEFRAALKINARYAPASLGLAQIELRRGKSDEALEFVSATLAEQSE